MSSTFNHNSSDFQSNKQSDNDKESKRKHTDHTLLSNDPDWDHKLATLFSIFENAPIQTLHSALISARGDLEQAIPLILSNTTNNDSSTRHAQDSSSTLSSAATDAHPRKKQRLIQPRLSTFLNTPRSSSMNSSISNSTVSQASSTSSPSSASSDPTTLLYRPSSTSAENRDNDAVFNLPSVYDRLRWKDGIDDTSTTTRIKPLILYKPEDVAKNCPCTLIFNILPKDLSTRLLKVMLEDSETWNRNRWWLFERMVESPHKTSYFAEREDDLEEVAGWTYNGKRQDPPRQFLPEMIEAKTIVRAKVNELRKSRTIHPYEVQGEWNCNVAAVNHYAHSKESVGMHADKLTYLGPRPTIGSLTLGATRFFRIRKVVPDAKKPDTASQMISIALPHNSLLVMWPPMQEEWKHEIPPVSTVTPHPISGTARINITYRLRRPGFSPEETPVCQCGVAMVLRCVFKNKANYGKYFYMCYAAGSQEGRTCGEFHWVDMEQKLGLVPLPPPPLSSGSQSRRIDEDGKVEEDRQGNQNKVGVEEASSSGNQGIWSKSRSPTELDLEDELREEDPALFNLPLDDFDEVDQQGRRVALEESKQPQHQQQKQRGQGSNQ